MPPPAPAVAGGIFLLFYFSLLFLIIEHYMSPVPEIFINFAFTLKKSRMAENINRIKVVLCEKNVKAKWLAEQLKVNPTTVSKWCTNTSQPDLYTLRSIASLLGVDVRRLLNSTEDMSIAAEPMIIYGIKND